MRNAIYVRVSTPNQVQTQTIDQQIQLLTQHLLTQDETLSVEAIFRDDGYSGVSLNRPGLDRLRDCIRHREIDRVLIMTPDRLARNYVHQMLLLEEFERAGCQVEYLERPMSHDPHDQLVLQIRSAVAEYERTLITDRMRRGRLMKLQAGALLPWTHPAYGYRVDPDHPRDPAGVSVDPTKAAVVADLFTRYVEVGESLHGLSRYLHEHGIVSPTGNPWWGLPTIRGILTNPVYVGTVYIGRMHYRPPTIRRSATHPLGRPKESGRLTPPEDWVAIAQIPAIIDHDLFNRVQEKLAHNQTFARRHNTRHFYLLRALVSCGTCLRASSARTVGKYSYYLCSGKGKPMHTSIDIPCAARFTPAQQLDALVWNDLCAVLTHPESLSFALERAHGGHWLPQDLQVRRDNYRKALRSVEQQRTRLTDAYLHGIIPLAEFERRRRDLDQRESALQSLDAQLQAQATQHAQVAQLATGMADFCQRVVTGLANATPEGKRQLVELLIDRVVVTDDQVEIRYVFPTHQGSEHTRFCHLRTDYFDAPYLVRIAAGEVTQQIGINVLRLRPTAQVGSRADAGDAHLSHMALHRLPIDDETVASQLGGDAA
jgi:site-specific DNA recombinase